MFRVSSKDNERFYNLLLESSNGLKISFMMMVSFSPRDVLFKNDTLDEREGYDCSKGTPLVSSASDLNHLAVGLCEGSSTRGRFTKKKVTRAPKSAHIQQTIITTANEFEATAIG